MTDDILAKPPYVPSLTVGTDQRMGDPVVACVWCKGPANYELRHVLALRSMVERHLSIEFDFVCLTDHEDATEALRSEGICPVLVAPNVPGWWQKIKLFDPSMWGGTERILYLDLDVVIVGDLRKFFAAAHHTVAIANFGVNFQHSKYNSSVMLFDPTGPSQEILRKFREVGPENVMKALHGDQCWIWRVMRDNIQTWPASWVQSYKYETRHRGPAPDTSVVVYHGDPKPWDCNDRISKEYG